MVNRYQWAILAIILLIAAWFRFSGLDWDGYNHYHPDERYISWVGTTIEFPSNWEGALEPRQSSFNPFYWPENAVSKGIVVEQNAQRRYAYGHLPLYLGVGAAKVANWVGSWLGPLLPDNTLFVRDILNQNNWIEFRHLTTVGRALAALSDTVTIGLVFILGRMLFGPLVGLLAATFLAFNVMHIQLSHFFVVDPFLTLFVVACLTSLVAAHQSRQRMRKFFLILGAVLMGLAVGAKFSAILLLLPLALAVAVAKEQSRRFRILTFFFLLLLVFLVFIITNPFAILDWTCDALLPGFSLGPLKTSELNLHSCFLMNLGLQGSMVRGSRDVPFVRQYLGTIPYIYFVEMQLKWGMGLLLGVVAFAGFGWGTWRVTAAARRWLPDSREKKSLTLTPVELGSRASNVTSSELLLLSWTVPYFVVTGVLAVKFMRYLQPLTPFLMIYGAALLLSIPRKAIRHAIIAVVLIGTGLYALSFVNIYQQPHPWIEASRWIYQNYETGTAIVSETWDDPLPDDLTVDEEFLRRTLYNNSEANWLSGTGSSDDNDKLQANLSLLAASDLLVIATNRNYGVIPRLPERYPISSQYYQLLFDGSLGYELMYTSMRSPNVFGYYVKPNSFQWPGLEPPTEVRDYIDGLKGLSLGRFDESFTVYDQPLVMIFENRGGMSAEEMESLFQLP